MQTVSTSIELAPNLEITITEKVTDCGWYCGEIDPEFEVALIEITAGTMPELSDYLAHEGGSEHIASLLEYHREEIASISFAQFERLPRLSYLYNY